MDKNRLIKDLKKIVGSEAVLYHPDDLLVFEYDGSIDRGTPTAVVFPSSAQEICEVVSLAYKKDIPVIPRGAGTGLSGGTISVKGGIEIALTRMRAILDIDVDNRIAIVEPGLVNLDLSNSAARFGLFFAPDPSSQRACTIGGNVAENAGGPHCLRYGVTTNHVLGLQVVLEDGSLVMLGDALRGRPGYDLVGSFVGSEGTMGVVTKVIAKLLPHPEAVRTILAAFPTIDQSSMAVSRVIGNGIVPTAMEMMDGMAINAVETAMKFGYPKDAGAILLIEVDGLIDQVNEDLQKIEDICRQEGSSEIRTASTSLERERLWAGRKGALGAMGVLAPNYYLVDGVVPRTQLLNVLRRVGEVSTDTGLPIANVFHAGDGNLHPCILFDEREPDILPRVLEAGGQILKTCVELGGTLTGEHGVGIEKKEFMPLVFSNTDMEAMRKVKEAFAPSGLFNPGKIFPGGPSCGELYQENSLKNVGSGAWI